MNQVTRRRIANQFFAVQAVVWAIISVLLVAKWAGAAESPVQQCKRVPMLQGKVGETVVICENVRGGK